MDKNMTLYIKNKEYESQRKKLFWLFLTFGPLPKQLSGSVSENVSIVW